MQVFMYCKITLHVLGVIAPIIRSSKNVTAASGTGHVTYQGNNLPPLAVTMHGTMNMKYTL